MWKLYGYNSDYFAEGEIRDTIKKAIKDLNDQKEKKFGRLKLCDTQVKQIMELLVLLKMWSLLTKDPTNFTSRNQLKYQN